MFEQTNGFHLLNEDHVMRRTESYHDDFYEISQEGNNHMRGSSAFELLVCWFDVPNIHHAFTAWMELLYENEKKKKEKNNFCMKKKRKEDKNEHFKTQKNLQ